MTHHLPQDTQGLSQFSGEDYESQWESRKMGCLSSLVQDREDTSSLTDLQIVQYHCDTDRVQAAHFQSMDAFTKKEKEMKDMSRASRKDSKNVHVSTTEDRNKIKALASELKEQCDYLMSKPDSDTENKNSEKYSQVSVKCVNNTAGGSNIIKGKSFFRKIQRKTATRKERRKRSSKKKVSSQNTKGQ